jgi:hypothetical protein
MKKEKIKSHLAKYSIAGKRSTTINHAFASAIAPFDIYAEIKEVKLEKALRLLGQDPDGELKCVYCELPAETWDHLIGLVENRELRGYGHQIGNLVPCCGACNSKKGAMDWVEYLHKSIPDAKAFEVRRSQICAYLSSFAVQIDLKRAREIRPELWKRYDDIKDEIRNLMLEADGIADQLRSFVALKQP